MAFDLFNADIDSFIEKVENELGLTKSKASPYPSNLHGVSSLIGQSSIIQMCAETVARNCATEGQIILKEGFRQNSKEDKKELRRATAILNCPDGRNTGDKLHYLVEKDRETVGAGFVKLFYNSQGKVESFHHIPSSWVTHIRTEINVPILVDSNNSKEDEKRAVVRDFDLYQITRVFNVVDSNANIGGDVDAGSIQRECIYECHCPYENPSDISNQKKEKLKKGKTYTRLMVFKHDIGDSKMGLPYWVGETGNLLALLAYDSLSHKMISNNLIPRLIIMLGGASFSKEQMEDMKEEFETQLSGGSASQNTPLFLNAAGQKATQVASPSEQPIIPEISIHEIKNAFNPESVKTFFSYVEDRVLKSYRIPRLLIGDTTNYNRATADTALQAVESQVFAPLRKEWDTFINNVVLGNGFEESQKITYKSKPMAIMPIEGILKMLTTLSNIGALTIKDVTNLAQQLVDIKLEEKSDEINKLLSAAVAKLQPTADGATASAVDKSKATKGETTKGPYQNTGQ